MKIVFLNRYFYPDYSATSQLLTDLAFHLARATHSVHVITSRLSYDSASSQFPAEEVIQGVHVTRIWTSAFGRERLWGRALDYGTFYCSAFVCLLRLARSGDIIVAKTDPPLISVVAAVSAKVRGALLINWIQDLFPEMAEVLGVGGIGGLEGMLRSARNWSLRTAYKNVAIGDGMATNLKEEGIQPGAIQVIHNWADGCAIQPVDREKNDLRREWHIQDMFVVGYSGNIGRGHEFDTILDAAEKLKSATNIVFLFIGGGAQRDRIEGEARRRGLENIMFKPYQPREQLPLSLTVPDVHLISLQPALEGINVPSKYYGIAAAGRPTIFVGDPDGEIPRILRKTGSGYTVSVGDSVGLGNRILEMFRNNNETLNMGLRARLAFDQHFDQRHAFAAWGQLLQQASVSP